MKRFPVILACLLSFAMAIPAQAHGVSHRAGFSAQHHGGHGGHASYGYGYRSGWSHNWVAPVLGAAIVGSVIYAASTPSYAMPPTVVVQQPYIPPSRVAYFCPTAQQYYPHVPTCQVPWQPVSY
jgi:hypothetical protein